VALIYVPTLLEAGPARSRCCDLGSKRSPATYPRNSEARRSRLGGRSGLFSGLALATTWRSTPKTRGR
jgi:hypothetical protein